MKRKRRRPKSIPVGGKSDRTRKRLAMALAWERLNWSDQNDYLNAATRVLEYLHEIV